MNKYKVLIIDGDYLMYRCIYQGGLRKLSHKYQGVEIPTGVIKGVLSSLHNYIKKFSPNTVYFCMSGGSCNFRKEIYSEYKNKPKDDSFSVINESDGEQFSSLEMLTIQSEILRKILPDFGIRVMSAPGFEADDCGLYTGYMYLADQNNYETILISDDWDWAQIVKYGGTLYRALKDELITNNNFEDITGIPSSMFIYYKALKGDTSDNIPSVLKGFGEKSIKKLLNSLYNDGISDLSVDNIINSSEPYLSKKTFSKLRERKEEFKRNMLLMSMNNRTMSDIKPYLEETWKEGVKFNYNKCSTHISELSMSSINEILLDPLFLKLS